MPKFKLQYSPLVREAGRLPHNEGVDLKTLQAEHADPDGGSHNHAPDQVKAEQADPSTS